MELNKLKLALFRLTSGLMLKDQALTGITQLSFNPISLIQNHIMQVRIVAIVIAALITLQTQAFAQQASEKFKWPEGKSLAISLSFDDARLSQMDGGAALLDEYGVKATFFVVPADVEKRHSGWKEAVKNGHEIGNHTLTHPCSGNYPWSRHKAIEDYTLDQMRREMVESNNKIEALLGVRPTLFAYPCGQTYVGRGANTKSYVPLVAGLFFVGRTYRDKIANDPSFCDFAQVTGIDMDNTDFEEILPLLESARKNGQWVVLGGHEIGESGFQTTRLAMLRKLMEYALEPANGVWIAPMGTVAKYISETRGYENGVQEIHR
jgi:peptidoglycan-N-acetylglucosamine deacetylase